MFFSLSRYRSPEEAAAALRRAADGGDGDAAGRLAELGKAAEEKAARARAQLERMAAAGDPRARALLVELGM